MTSNLNIRENIAGVYKRIEITAAACGRDPHSIRLIAVSKTQPTDKIREAIRGNARILGENYIQEARTKIETLGGEDVSWHFIGHLQRNKAKYAVKMFDLIHTVDSVKLAKEIDKKARQIDKVQKILLQINIGHEESKSGVHEAEVLELAQSISSLANIKIEGLMSIPPLYNDPEGVRPYFRSMRLLAQKIEQAQLPSVGMKELSMGMTGDFEVAIEEGATLVRVGTAIFGERA